MMGQRRSRDTASDILKQVEFHRELANLAFERGDLRFEFSNDTGSSLFFVQIVAVMLRQPELYKIGRKPVSSACITTPDLLGANVRAQLQRISPLCRR